MKVKVTDKDLQVTTQENCFSCCGCGCGCYWGCYCFFFVIVVAAVVVNVVVVVAVIIGSHGNLTLRLDQKASIGARILKGRKIPKF